MPAVACGKYILQIGKIQCLLIEYAGINIIHSEIITIVDDVAIRIIRDHHSIIRCIRGSIFKDFSLAVNTCNVDASGGSIINISINKELKADASGGSIINYKGKGVISSVDASGGSSIKKKD